MLLAAEENEENDVDVSFEIAPDVNRYVQYIF